MLSDSDHAAVSPLNSDQPLSLSSPSNSHAGRILEIDGLRALAMLMVYTYHVWEFSGSPSLKLGFHSFSVSVGEMIGQFPAGVDLFMVLSGFCLFYPIAGAVPKSLSQWSWKSFARRRIRRIVPPYYAAILFVTVLPIALTALWRVLGLPAKTQPMAGSWQYVTHLLFIHTLFPSTWGGIQGTFWSLGLEAQFYLVFPLVVFAYRKFGIRVVWVMTALSIVYRIIIGICVTSSNWLVPFLFSITFIGRWMQFAAGMFAAWFVVQRRAAARPIKPLGSNVLLALAVILYTVALLAQVQQTRLFPSRDVLLAMAFATAMTSLCAGTSFVGRFFANRLMAGLGFISYSIFLIHQNTIFYFGELLKKVAHIGDIGRFALFMTAGFAFIVGVSYVFFRLFEAPFLKKKRMIISCRTTESLPVLSPTAVR